MNVLPCRVGPGKQHVERTAAQRRGGSQHEVEGLTAVRGKRDGSWNLDSDRCVRCGGDGHRACKSVHRSDVDRDGYGIAGSRGRSDRGLGHEREVRERICDRGVQDVGGRVVIGVAEVLNRDGIRPLEESLAVEHNGEGRRLAGTAGHEADAGWVASGRIDIDSASWGCLAALTGNRSRDDDFGARRDAAGGGGGDGGGETTISTGGLDGNGCSRGGRSVVSIPVVGGGDAICPRYRSCRNDERGDGVLGVRAGVHALAECRGSREAGK